MTGILVDSNVLLDILVEDPDWFEWSAASVAEADAVLGINALVYAEVSMGFSSASEVDEVLPETVFRRLPLPWEAAFLAGQAFLTYRRRGGSRRSPLPDLYIGAHAEVAGFRLLTRDASRYRTYFPDVELIAPDG